MQKEIFCEELRKHTIDIGVAVLMVVVLLLASQAKSQQTKQQQTTTIHKVYNDSIKQNIR